MSKVTSCKDVVKEGAGTSRRGQPPTKRAKKEELLNPCSGRYEGSDKNMVLEMMVDVDEIRKFSPSLGVISGTMKAKHTSKLPWSGSAQYLFFTVINRTLKVIGEGTLNREYTADAKVTFNDGKKAAASLRVQLQLPQDVGTWKATLDLEIVGDRKLSIGGVERKSLFFKDIKLDIDYTEKVVWPVAVLADLSIQTPGMEDRKIDAFSAFEDAGLKLHYDEAHSEKVEDPTPHSPWTKADLYEVMMHYFDEIEDSDDNIWCMMGSLPPDKRYMGFSFDRLGRRGFGLFTGHSSFSGLDSENPGKKADAQRRLLHYLVHECGHCLGLKHPFEIGAPNSLSWMNYAWRYDVSHEPGSFYRDFTYSFSEKELLILRHTPSKDFQKACGAAVLASVMGAGYNMKTDVPDAKLADDDSDDDVEADVTDDVGVVAKKKSLVSKPKPARKISLDLQIRQEPFLKGQLISFRARLKNEGKLPALVEGDLSLESGNLQLYITTPDGSVQIVDPFVRPVQTGYSRPLVLYTSEDEEGLDRYSELVIVGEGTDGYQFEATGKYGIRAVYVGGRYRVTSPDYSILIGENNDPDEDDDTASQVSVASSLSSSSWSRFRKAQGYWKKLMGKSVDYKKTQIAALVALMEGLSKDTEREPVYSSGKRTRRGRRKKAMAKSTATFAPREMIKDTADLVQYFQEQGTKSENLDYSKLIFARGRLLLIVNRTKEADVEFNQMLADLVTRGVKYDVLKKISKTWNKMKNPTPVEDKSTPAYLQKKVNAVLTWSPSVDGNGEKELSGIGLGVPFSNFLIPQLKKASRILEIIFSKYDETKNLLAVISYADKLQKGREVNYMVLRWALEAFIVHSMEAKRAGIKYPEPDNKDQSMSSDAAMTVTTRKGEPTEDWMNYWRCDADFNYHHRHFHMVYVVSQFLRRDATGNQHILGSAPGHLERQGELFGYMHTQLLARYDADRESWGLKPVAAWEYDERAMSFNAGLEFHSDGQFRQYAPRPNTVWPAGAVRLFQEWEANYRFAVGSGFVADGVELSPNWAGHILEPSSGIYEERYGSFHNAGHGLFGSTGLPPMATSYMNDTATAVRDPIFYRWHKRIDNLWHENNEYFRSDIGSDAPPVTITADDIIIDQNEKPPAGYDQWRGDWATKAPGAMSCLETYLGPPTKKYEWDNKLSHGAFYYHLRVKRSKGSGYSAGELPLTFRIFICPKNRETERRRWIEMDKFVYKMPQGVDHAVITRADTHSSVIKRLPKYAKDDVEVQFTETVGGFCECGWPYTMLLPRGTSAGQEYRLCVVVTDNNIDSIGVRTTCGSMSYCGARGEKYPDARYMGYPFCSPVIANGETGPLPEIFDRVSNAAYKSFIIKNNVSEPPPVPAADVWWPHMQLRQNDGTLRRETPNGITEFVQSDLIGHFRVLIDNDAAYPAAGDQMVLRFQGRGARGGAYSIRDVTIGRREGMSLNIDPTSKAVVLSKGQSRISVPEEGLISDVFALRFHPAFGDYFVTFTLESPGVYLPASQNTQTSTYFIRSHPFDNTPPDWNLLESRISGRYAHIHCISGLMTSLQVASP